LFIWELEEKALKLACDQGETIGINIYSYGRTMLENA
jgi:hypothetical protein